THQNCIFSKSFLSGLTQPIFRYAPNRSGPGRTFPNQSSAHRSRIVILQGGTFSASLGVGPPVLAAAFPRSQQAFGLAPSGGAAVFWGGGHTHPPTTAPPCRSSL